MLVDSDDLVSGTDLSRNTAAYVREAANGRRFVILNNSVPRAALVSMADLEILLAAATPRPAKPGPDGFLEALGIEDLSSYDPRPVWAQTDDPDVSLTVPIGVAENVPYELNLTETPSGLLVGMTGSGKTHLLTLMMLGLCARYSPQRLQIWYADRKSGRAITHGLPHVTALQDAETSTPLADANLYRGLTEEISRRSALATLDAEPDLFVIVDDDGALHDDDAARRDFLQMAAQRLHGLRMTVIVSTQPLPPTLYLVHFDYRIAMRTRTLTDTSAALGEHVSDQVGIGEAFLRSTNTDRLTVVRPYPPTPGLLAELPVDQDDDGEQDFPRDLWMDVLADRIVAASA